MYKIGLIGHTPENIKDHQATKQAIEYSIGLIRFQYGDDLIFNLAGDIGSAEYATKYCSQYNIKYHLFLPFPPENMEMLWYPEQYKLLKQNFKYAWATTVSTASFKKSADMGSAYQKTYKHIIDGSQFVLCFWGGMKQGVVYESIKYALNKNTLLIDGFKNLQLITKNDI